MTFKIMMVDILIADAHDRSHLRKVKITGYR